MPITPEQQNEKDRLGAIRRRGLRLEQLVTGWLELPGLPDNPDRDAILATLNDHDRRVVLTIEGIYVRADGGFLSVPEELAQVHAELNRLRTDVDALFDDDAPRPRQETTT